MNRAESRRQRKLAKKGTTRPAGANPGGDQSAQQQNPSIQHTLNVAMQHHGTGDLAKAEGMYRQILQAAPNQPVALHLLGVIAHQVGENDQAVELITKSLNINPDYAEARNNLGLSLQELERKDEAVVHYQKAIEINPDYAEAHYNLGNTLEVLGRLDEAIDHYSQAININPEFDAAHYNLANALKTHGQLDGAVDHYRKSLDLNPNQAEAHFSLATILEDLGRRDEGMVHYCKAIDINPGFTEAYFNLGNAHQHLEQLNEAVEYYHKTIDINPDFAEVYYNLANALNDLGRAVEAADYFRKSIDLNPEKFEAYFDLGNVLKELGQLDEAVYHYQEYIKINPDFPGVHNNLGSTFMGIGKLNDAVAEFRIAIDMDPDNAGPHNNLGNALQGIGQLDEAINHYRKAIEMEPDNARHYSNLLMCLHYHPEMNASQIKQEHEKWWQLHGRDCPVQNPVDNADISPDRPLRIGMVSPDFRHHPVGFLAIKLLENIESQDFQIFCYSDRTGSDKYTKRFTNAAYKWTIVDGFSDDQLADLIQKDQIDILVDMAGHTANNRLKMFGRKPAPVQISWCGYVCTTGIPAIDYIIVDRFHIPPGEEQYYTEKVRRLPHSSWCYDAPEGMPDVGPQPAKSQGYVTFGCFNNPAKINPQTLDRWCKILARTPDSKLLLKYKGMDSPYNKERILSIFQNNNIDKSRILFEGYSPFNEFSARYNSVDIALDTLPFSGGITTCEALWMGVPVVTLPGKTFPGRHSLSHLSNIELTGLIADDCDDYVDIAVSLAGDLDALSRIRGSLREQMKASPLCHGPQFAEEFGRLMREIWLNYVEKASDQCLR